MSSGSDSRGAWLQQNYEKLAVVAVLVGLLVSTAVLVLRIRQGHRLLADTDRGVPADRQAPVPPADLGRIQRSMERMAHPPTVGLASEQRMLYSEVRVHCVECMKPILFSAMRCPFCNADQPEIREDDPDGIDSSGDGIPDRWHIRFGFDPMDPYLHLRDADGDGFTVKEEYLAGTDPTDRADSPPPVMKLRLQEVRTTPFRLRFIAVQQIVEGDNRFQINDRVLNQSFFPRLGDMVSGYLVESYDADARTLILSRGDNRIALRRGEVQQGTERALVLRSLLDNTEIHTRIDQPFDLRGVTYQVVDIVADGIRVQQVGDEDKLYTVGRLTEDERAALLRQPGDHDLDPFIDEDPEGVRPLRRPPGGPARLPPEW